MKTTVTYNKEEEKEIQFIYPNKSTPLSGKESIYANKSTLLSGKESIYANKSTPLSGKESIYADRSTPSNKNNPFTSINN